jgi:hypothetical protein
MAPKIISIDGHMTNAEVASFLKKKREQHKQEDDADKANGKAPLERPKNLVKSLDKHERHLNSPHYPHEKNPSAYATDEARADTFKDFQDKHMQRVQVPLFESFKEKVKAKLMTGQEGKQKLEVEQEKKELTETELLMIENHAPTDVTLLQPMIDNAENRFTPEELQVIVDCVKETWRKDENTEA